MATETEQDWNTGKKTLEGDDSTQTHVIAIQIEENAKKAATVTPVPWQSSVWAADVHCTPCRARAWFLKADNINTDWRECSELHKDPLQCPFSLGVWRLQWVSVQHGIPCNPWPCPTAHCPHLVKVTYYIILSDHGDFPHQLVWS